MLPGYYLVVVAGKELSEFRKLLGVVGDYRKELFFFFFVLQKQKEIFGRSSCWLTI